MKKSVIIFLLFSQSFLAGFVSAKENKIEFYKKVFPTTSSLTKIKIDDPISDKPINTVVFKVLNSSNKDLGYIREVVTTTGCNSACLPVIFTLFYDSKKKFKKLLSKDGLTKLGHAQFSEEDYQKLELILVMNPKSFAKVINPIEMTDAISGATKKEFENDVVKEAAYSSLRINLYNQHTLNFLKSL